MEPPEEITPPAAPAPDGESTPHGILDERRRIVGLVMLGAGIFLLSLGNNVHVAANTPFLNNVLHATKWQQSWLEAARESCGILSFFVIAFFVGRSEPRLSTLMLVLTGAGLGAYYVAGEIWHVLVLSLVWSFGLHMWMPLANSMQLGLARPGREGETLGRMRSVGYAGFLTGVGGAAALNHFFGVQMRPIFLIAGVLTGVGAIPVLAVPEIRLKSAARMPLARALAPRHRLYCGIELLDGMRKQVFLLFAPMALVIEYGVPMKTIALLIFISQVLAMVVAPLAGRAVDRFGERPVLSIYFASVFVLFSMYATIKDVRFLYGIYVIDHAMFVLKVALHTYAGRIAAPGERTQLLAMGVTMNHIGAVTLPLVGGALYTALGYQFPFYCGMAVAFVSALLVQLVPPRAPSPRSV